MALYTEISPYEAQPLEKIRRVNYVPSADQISGNQIQLPTVPFIDYDGLNYNWSYDPSDPNSQQWPGIKPVVVRIGGTQAVDITPYYNMRIIPYLNAYDPPTVPLQFYLNKANIYVNTTDIASIGTVSIEYEYFAETVQIETKLIHTNTNYPKLEQYQAKIHVQEF